MMNWFKFPVFIASILVISSFDAPKPAWKSGRIENPKLYELSGLAPSLINAGKYWGHNDSMNSPHLYLLGADGKDYGQIHIDGALNLDWEAIQTAKCNFADACIYIGDIGDNLGFRDSIRIEIIIEPKQGAKSAKISQTLIFKYPDGKHNAESLLITKDGKNLYLIEKLDWENRKKDINVYGAPIPVSKEKYINIKLSQQAKIKNNAPKFGIGSITDATLSNNTIYFRDYRNIFQINGFKGQNENLKPILLNAPKIKQSEALTLTPDGAHLLSGSEGKNSKLILIPIKKAK